MRKLTDLTQLEYVGLKEMGFLYEFFPEATGDYSADCKTLSIEIVRSALCNHFSASPTSPFCYDDCTGCAVDNNENFIRWFQNTTNKPV